MREACKVPFYGSAIATGDHLRMKQTATGVEQHLAEHGKVVQLLEVLKIDIATIEADI